VPLVYFDSSAFVKLLVEEEGSNVAATLWDGCDAAIASRLAYPEVRAALAAAVRNHDHHEHEVDTAASLPHGSIHRDQFGVVLYRARQPELAGGVQRWREV
jgi:predicted nucleic acid-binding protein